jgi:GAF domain-containing protein
MQLLGVDSGVRLTMINPEHKLFCRLDGLTPVAREQKRLNTLQSLGLLEPESIPVFEEATQTAARFLETPICILTLMVQEELWIKSAVGLSRIGLMNQLATSRKIPRQESFCTYVVDSQQFLTIEDTLAESVFVRSALVVHYGIRSYLGTPLITGNGECIGTLAVMDLVPHTFSDRDVEFLNITARWCLREFERDRSISDTSSHSATSPLGLAKSTDLAGLTAKDSGNLLFLPEVFENSSYSIKVQLLEQLIQELRTPLTSVIGMASVLKRELYGPLTNKQKEYLDIIYNSGQHLSGLVEEIVNLEVLDKKNTELHLVSVELEMLCQQVINSLFEIARQKQQEFRLSVEPGQRIWSLDKDKVRQSLYYLVVSVLNSAEPGGEVRIHVSRKSKTLNIAVWVSHPYLGDGLPQVELSSKNPLSLALEKALESSDAGDIDSLFGEQALTSENLAQAWHNFHKQENNSLAKMPREILGLLLSCYLAEAHEGKIAVQGSSVSGYRYVLKLPKVATD